MADSIINSWKKEVAACNKEHHYWMGQAEFYHIRAEKEDDAIMAACYRAEAARCEHFAEEATKFLEHLNLLIQKAEETL